MMLSTNLHLSLWEFAGNEKVLNITAITVIYNVIIYNYCNIIIIM
jgi:hypothetical protein